jgi:hypothetical protein
LLDSLGLTAVPWPSSEQPEHRQPGVLVIADDGRDVAALVGRAADLGVVPVVVEALGSGSGASLAMSGVARGALLIGDFAAAGLRSWGVGYVAGPVELLQGLVDLKQGLNICTAGVSQHAAVAAVEELNAPSGDAAELVNVTPAADRSRATDAPLSPLVPRVHGARRESGSGSRVSDEATRQR